MKKFFFLSLLILPILFSGCDKKTRKVVPYGQAWRDVYIGATDESGELSKFSYIIVYDLEDTTRNFPTFWYPGNQMTYKYGYIHLSLPEGTYKFETKLSGGVVKKFNMDVHADSSEYVKDIHVNYDHPVGVVFEKDRSNSFMRSPKNNIINIECQILDMDKKINRDLKRAFAHVHYRGLYHTEVMPDSTFEMELNTDNNQEVYRRIYTIPENIQVNSIQIRAGYGCRSSLRGWGEASNNRTYRYQGEEVFKKTVPYTKSLGDWRYLFSKIDQASMVIIYDSTYVRDWMKPYY